MVGLGNVGKSLGSGGIANDPQFLGLSDGTRQLLSAVAGYIHS
jgi:hypothetical protein